MSIERRVSLSSAAKSLGIKRQTLRNWLIVDLGMVFPPVARGSMHLVREADVEAVARLHSPKQNLTLLRTRTRKAS